MLQLCKFLFFNSLLNLFDVVTDLILFYNLEEQDHVFWAGLTMTWMWTPFFSHLAFFCCKIVGAWVKWSSLGSAWPFREKSNAKTNYAKQKTYYNEVLVPLLQWKTFYNEVLVHLPFLVPFQNIKRAVDLYRLGYGTDALKASDFSKVRTTFNKYIRTVHMKFQRY